MRGVVLAGGTGSRLWPLTIGVNKHLLPVFDKPLIYYPISTLMLAGIRDLLVVVRPEDLDAFTKTLGDGDQWGVNIRYEIQESPRGIADALLVGESFLAGQPFALILGDNIFHGPSLGESLRGRLDAEIGTVFAYEVADVSSYACIEIDSSGNIASIVEKPTVPRSSMAVPGLYFLPSDAINIAKGLSPGIRGELEITDLNSALLAQGRLRVVPLPRGTAWLDAGTQDDLLDASNYVRVLQERQGGLIASPEEVALRNGWIDMKQVHESLGGNVKGSTYASTLLRVLDR